LAKPLLSIGIVTFNSAGTIDSCLNSITRFFPKEAIEILVIDNCSDDNTVDLLQDNFLVNRLMVNQRNVGFATAVNRLIAEREGKHLLLLNPDCELQTEFLPAIADVFAARERAGIVGADIRTWDNRPKESYGAFPTPSMVMWDFSGLRKLFPRRNWSTSIPFSGTVPIEVDYPTGAFYCMREEVLATYGSFDPRFFAYFEETDYALRIREKGFRAIVHPGIRVRHLGGASFEAANEKYGEDFQLTCYFDSLFYYMEKHFGKPAAVKLRRDIARFAAVKAFIGGPNSAFGTRHAQVLRIVKRLESSTVREIFRV
jgi:GT2 family glycosyltransferase